MPSVASIANSSNKPPRKPGSKPSTGSTASRRRTSSPTSRIRRRGPAGCPRTCRSRSSASGTAQRLASLHSLPFGSRIHAPWALAISASRGGGRVRCPATLDGRRDHVPLLDADRLLGRRLPARSRRIEERVTEQLDQSALFAAQFPGERFEALLIPRMRPGRGRRSGVPAPEPEPARGRAELSRLPDHARDVPLLPAGRVRPARTGRPDGGHPRAGDRVDDVETRRLRLSPRGLGHGDYPRNSIAGRGANWPSPSTGHARLLRPRRSRTLVPRVDRVEAPAGSRSRDPCSTRGRPRPAAPRGDLTGTRSRRASRRRRAAIEGWRARGASSDRLAGRRSGSPPRKRAVSRCLRNRSDRAPGRLPRPERVPLEQLSPATRGPTALRRPWRSIRVVPGRLEPVLASLASREARSRRVRPRGRPGVGGPEIRRIQRGTSNGARRDLPGPGTCSLASSSTGTASTGIEKGTLRRGHRSARRTPALLHRTRAAILPARC